MKSAAIILAAGESSRMGSPKALLDAGGETFLQRLTRIFREAGCEVIVVSGAHPLAGSVENPDWRSGQLSSVRRGLAATDAERVLVHPVDVPLVTPDTVRRVLERLGSAEAVVPTWRGTRGHPLGLTAQAVRKVQAWNDLPHLEGALLRLAAVELAVVDPGVVRSANTPAEYQALFGRPPG